MESAEQQARDMLARMGVPDAQSYSSGDLMELANLIAEAKRNKLIRPDCWDFAMSLIGDPEAAEIQTYVEALESYCRLR
jgi:hypothetical protein